MWKFIFIQVLFTLLTTTTIVISQDKYEENPDALIVNDNQPNKTNIKCACSEDELCDGNTRTCQLSQPHHQCYQRWEVNSDGRSVQHTAGCLLNDYFFLRVICGTNETNRFVICCADRNFCNDRDPNSPDLLRRLSLTSSELPHKPKSPISILIIIIVVFAIVALIIVFAGIFIYVKHKNWQRRRPDYPKTICYPNEHNKQNIFYRSLKYFKCLGQIRENTDEMAPKDQEFTGLLEEYSTSTTGQALPVLMQRTLARQIALGVRIGAGRYGDVYQGKWREDHVAVKIFSTNDERSWFREIDIYQTVCLRHENILGYIAADNMDASTYTQLWLVTEYHENGSVYDYLMNHTISIPILLKMMSSIASGLCHLHLPIDSTNGKVALAHRDLKTKNILVKKDLSCCIADLGLAVKEVRSKPKSRKDLLLANPSKQEQVVIDIQANSRVGTLRYMAPEVLDGTLNEQSFESFKAADIYALGLVYWEMLRRCQLSATENDADSYQVPYEDILPNNPSTEQMREVVCTKKIRPPSSARWQTHPILSSLFQLCEELWIADPACRLQSLNIKRQLKAKLESLESDLSNINIESQQQATPNDGPWTA
ncbi:unnamed protein product [Adineta ricciae]|uniref:receptor protein serine/threonine kinase n=1 Tax=Adineta ricciae TaxID=249248 RepID=A0A816E1V7_ADIRI|nr:unnamed protein product [Adineta ricciae]